MSNICLLLLLVAAFQFAHSYPAEYELEDEYLSDVQRNSREYIIAKLESFAETSKEWAVAKAKEWAAQGSPWAVKGTSGLRRPLVISKEKLKEMFTYIHKKLCTQEESVEIDENESDEAQGEINISKQFFVELHKKMVRGKRDWREDLKKAVVNILPKICTQLSTVIENL
uniref:Venom redulysin-related 1 n=1 Tax=Platymeris rhadamanthus TaxID=1134088 RepID=A0A6B9KZB1_PLARH|nr:venom redulysin-related 1 [Platymeris rhadamanthus]